MNIRAMSSKLNEKRKDENEQEKSKHGWIAPPTYYPLGASCKKTDKRGGKERHISFKVISKENI